MRPTRGVSLKPEPDPSHRVFSCDAYPPPRQLRGTVAHARHQTPEIPLPHPRPPHTAHTNETAAKPRTSLHTDEHAQFSLEGPTCELRYILPANARRPNTTFVSWAEVVAVSDACS